VVVSLGVLVIGVALVLASSACGGGGGDKPPTATREPADSGGLATREAATPEATIALGGNTGGVVQPPTVLPGDNATDRIVIPKANVNAPLTLATVPPSGGELSSPKGADDVVFYNFANFPGLGGYPGIGGNSLFSGHVDYGRGACKNGTVPPPCQAVFWDISDLSNGDMIEIQLQGQVFRYRVTGAEDIAATDYARWDKVWASTAQETVTLITCGGDFNRTTREYSHRRVVTAVRV
jgi:hypothetical protein